MPLGGWGCGAQIEFKDVVVGAECWRVRLAESGRRGMNCCRTDEAAEGECIPS